MRSKTLSYLLLGLVVLASAARAQRDYNAFVRVSRLAGLSPSGFAAELSEFGSNLVAVDPSDVLYGVSDRAILRYSPDSAVAVREVFFRDAKGDRVPAKFWARGLAVDGYGNAYLTNQGAVWKISPEGAITVLADDLNSPQGVAVDLGGNLYVAEMGSHVIRKISGNGAMSTLAGRSGEAGSADGVESARFNGPMGVAVDRSGNLFVADSKNHTIRKITADGLVSTFAGSAGRAGNVNGVGAAARFDTPYSIAIDHWGTLYVTDYILYGVRKITADGGVTLLTISGGFEALVEAGFLNSVAIGTNGTLYFTDGWYWSVLASAAPPSLAEPLLSRSAAPGGSVAFRAVVDGAEPITCQWLKDGVEIPGATDPALSINNVQASSLGTYTVRAANAVGRVVSNPARLSFPATHVEGLVTFAIRGRIGPDLRGIIVGFATDGGAATTRTPWLIRSLGPALGSSGVRGFLADPTLFAYSNAAPVGDNDNWNGAPEIARIGEQVGGFALPPTPSRDASLYLPSLGLGTYAVHVHSVAPLSGLTLVEILDARTSAVAGDAPHLVNVSALAWIGAGPPGLLADFNVAGTTDKTFLIRAVGPALRPLGVTRALADPKLELYRDATLLQANDNWGGDASIISATTKVSAFALDAASRDAVIRLTLPPGTYTAQVRGAGDAAGIVLLEIYEVP